MVWFAGFVFTDVDPISIEVQPLGTISRRMQNAVQKRLQKVFVAEVEIVPRLPLPKSAFYPPRSRYRADRLLPILAKSPFFDKVIGLTSVDISTTKPPHNDWGVFGLGTTGGKSCVVSDFRLHKKGSISATERLCRVAVHEIGHTLGLDHCPTPHCTMSDAKGALRTVDEETGFCDLCKRKVKAIR